jgi:hypothetical protein
MESWPESEKFKGIDMELLAKIEASRSTSAENQFRAAQPPNALVQSLLHEQPVKIRRYRKRGSETPEISLLKQAIELGLVLVTFTGTKVAFARLRFDCRWCSITSFLTDPFVCREEPSWAPTCATTRARSLRATPSGAPMAKR